MLLEKLGAAQDRAGRIAAGLTPRGVLGKLATIQMLDVCIPTVEGRELLLIRHTEPSTDVALLPERLNLTLPPQPLPKICEFCAKSGPAWRRGGTSRLGILCPIWGFIWLVLIATWPGLAG